ncbi:dihydroorotate dehydrogenase electron transfer subunit [Oryzomonas rubra]|uniref:Dihydroorotate dehydrogenase B (NAD(+)), electron transfer subunit n=1 Tax=Oryzomonas rubra TaxID=2509454 RepID=A0A5A9X9G5_9BACT|nr:dihydroorotate dehydrogenase electron transfer subunit [Oryzomonas rubra]KAA0888281.1 dihydroorotate dehydrogenase electron transfer subunit [Oryzomonas rubra]
MQFKSMIISNVEVSPGYWRMRMTAPSEFPAAQPGQFVMVRVNDAIDPLLRRPFGIFDVGVHTPAQTGAASQPYLEMLYRVVGKGTGMLSALHNTDLLDVLGPLGKGFELGSPEEEKIIVGGGVGLAPLYLLAKELVKQSSVRLFVGGRTRDDVLCITEFERLGVECYVATEDGSLGECGLVTEALVRRLAACDGTPRIFACGPHGMLNAVAGIAAQRNIPCQVSLEGYMACGMGACLGCVTPGHHHSNETPDYRCVCADGPVFDAAELKWEA